MSPEASLGVILAGAVLLQWVAFVPAYLARTERFYDLTGSLTYLSAMAAGLALAPERGLREWVLAGMVTVWAARLGTFLARRIHKDGKDGRFDTIKQSAPRFFVAWTLQGLWVSLTALAVLIVLTTPGDPAVGAVDVVGWTIWVAGFGLEVVADRQKSAFRARDTGRWIDEGVWSWSRHPNYLGEIVLWVGICVSAATTFSGWRWVGVVSPVFVAFLLLRVSGIPMLERRADKRWGGDPDYEAYKERMPVLVPGVGKKAKGT